MKKFRVPKVPKVSRRTVQLAVQAVGVLYVLIGVGTWSPASAWILCGLTLIFAIERQD